MDTDLHNRQVVRHRPEFTQIVDNNGISICMDSIWIKKSIDDQPFVAAAPMTRSVPTDTLDECVILWKAPTCTNIFYTALKMSNGRSVRNQHPLFVPHPLDPFNGWFNPNRQKYLTPPTLTLSLS